MSRPHSSRGSVPEVPSITSSSAVRQERPPPGRLAVGVDDGQPPWLIGVRRRIIADGALRVVSQRRAAILVVLVDDGAGPRVLLTRRADHLHYLPGAITFPGGSLEVTDGGPVAAALREAEEEIALDPASVDVLGRFPDRTTADKRFVVTPVIAWTRHLHLAAAPSPDEVSGVGLIPLADLSALLGRGQPTRICFDISTPGRPGTTLEGPVPPMTAALLVEIAAACESDRSSDASPAG
ncbi:MAG: NUDIX domain-containing protein [Acidimicrobiales bacterium]|nr:NUDIX domain-containing protein [Acidimicrobiales bacterium]